MAVEAPIVAGFGLGLALAGAPGPVQAVLMGEAIRGGLARGFRAMAGANLTFALLLLALAAGLSVAPPNEGALRLLEIAGGALLLWLALDGFRSSGRIDAEENGRRSLPPTVRGTLAVLLNPGAWVFLATAASSLFSTATETGGTEAALLSALAMSVGLAIGDGAVVLLGGIGVRRAGERVARWVRRVLAAVLAGLGVWLILKGVIS